MNAKLKLFDLTDRRNSLRLDPLAAFKTLALMCYPSDVHNRERMIGSFQKETGSRTPRRSPFDYREVEKELKFHNIRGGQIGSLLLIMVQLRLRGHEASMRFACKLQQEILLQPWSTAQALHWGKDSHLDHMPRSREVILENARHYSSVAHLWAAHVHSIQAFQNPREDDFPSWPDSPGGFLRFLGYAEAFWKLEAGAKASRGSTNGSWIGEVQRWKMHVPSDLKVSPTLEALPIPDAWEPIITNYRKLRR